MYDKNTIQRAITDRFLKAVVAVGLSEKEVALNVGVQPQHLNRLKSNTNTYVQLHSCQLLCEKYGINPVWLLMGKGKMRS